MSKVFKVLSSDGITCKIDRRSDRVYPFNWVGIPDAKDADAFAEGLKAKPPTVEDVNAAAEQSKKDAEKAEKEQLELQAKKEKEAADAAMADLKKALADAQAEQVTAAQAVEAANKPDNQTGVVDEAAVTAANAKILEINAKVEAAAKEVSDAEAASKEGGN